VSPDADVEKLTVTLPEVNNEVPVAPDTVLLGTFAPPVDPALREIPAPATRITLCPWSTIAPVASAVIFPVARIATS
jgi:hypothetical protein